MTVVCQRGHVSDITAAPKALHRVAISLDYTPCPASDPAHSFSSSGRERAREGKITERLVASGLFGEMSVM